MMYRKFTDEDLITKLEELHGLVTTQITLQMKLNLMIMKSASCLLLKFGVGKIKKQNLLLCLLKTLL